IAACGQPGGYHAPRPAPCRVRCLRSVSVRTCLHPFVHPFPSDLEGARRDWVGRCATFVARMSLSPCRGRAFWHVEIGANLAHVRARISAGGLPSAVLSARQVSPRARHPSVSALLANPLICTS